MKKNEKFWCWWLSRTLYFTGRVVNRGEKLYIFEDISGIVSEIREESLKGLEKR